MGSWGNDQDDLVKAELLDLAQYYPSLLCLISVRILSCDVVASNDVGTIGHDIRHFIDVELLRSLEGGPLLLESIVPPIPACKFMAGKAMDEQTVLGMIPTPLKVKWVYEGESVVLFLDNVLVVNRLPVPLHISTKNFEKLPNSHRRCLSCSPIKFNVDNVPVSFRQHPYWTSNRLFAGGAATTSITSLNRLQDRLAKKGGPNEFVCKACAVCDERTNLKKCGRCSRIYYCCREHQAEHWPTHKHTCQRK